MMTDDELASIDRLCSGSHMFGHGTVEELVSEVRRLRAALSDRRAMHEHTIDGNRIALAGYAERERKLQDDLSAAVAEVDRLRSLLRCPECDGFEREIRTCSACVAMGYRP